jgi:hypothetical protein
MRAAWHLCSLDFDAWARMDGTKSVVDSVHWQPNGCPRFPLSYVSCLVQLVLSCWKDLTGFVFSCSAQWEHTVTVETLLLCWHVENLQVSVLGKRLIGGSLQSKKNVKQRICATLHSYILTISPCSWPNVTPTQRIASTREPFKVRLMLENALSVHFIFG